jgi:hypothetical protein
MEKLSEFYVQTEELVFEQEVSQYFTLHQPGFSIRHNGLPISGLWFSEPDPSRIHVSSLVATSGT